ncbi:hypothetical protein HNR65_001805 [Desulfosalsimonas propionicica]|uniref:Uncharacterized protein n=1 Tax=Desulfosalsimonas propionicica TaxID=332175 RepID=A0A7W0HKR6_9BACT|nr:glycosyl transferase [Desulfosalsimonas propionicica]MBA2881478.1 hypothetical protein [Desulfosalsimonas propionicica]
MSIKNRLKNSTLFPLLVYLRYWANRYAIKRVLTSDKLAKGFDLKPVDPGINFFGYYNMLPENKKGEILYLKVNQEETRGSLFESASIMLKNPDGSTSKISETKAWNWQQGCMLQWAPGADGRILFNDYDPETDRYIAKVIDKFGNPVARYDIPVNNVSKCGNFALSLNYDRLAKMRPDYGYFNKKDQTLPPDDQDGIWYLDLKTGAYKLILSLESLKNLAYVPTMDGAGHKVNHIDINPDGTRFMFLHRWVGPQGRFMRLVTADPDGSNLCILNGDKMTSHCCWADNNEIIAFCQYNEKRGYFKFNDKSKAVRFLSAKMPKTDGHPSVSPNGQWLVTDTYPDKSRMSHLYLYNMFTDDIIHLGRFYQPLKYKKLMRVDLHPKWSKNGKSVFFESAHNSNRKLYELSTINQKAKNRLLYFIKS